MKDAYLFTIIVPLVMGFFAFLSKKLYYSGISVDRLKKIDVVINLAYMACFFWLIILTICSIFYLKLFNGIEYKYVIGGWSKTMGIELKYNIHLALSVMIVLLISIVFFATNLYNEISYALRGFVCIMVCGANGIILTNDIFNSYVFFEIVCITSYIVYAHSQNADCIKNTFNYMILSGLSGVIFLLIAGLLYQTTGHLNIDAIKDVISRYQNNKSINALFVLFVLVMFFKLGVYPLHSILMSVYNGLSTKYLLVVAGISSVVYPIFVLKMILNVFGINVLLNNEYLHICLQLLGGIGFVFFSVSSLNTKYFKKFIISLSFAQTSLFALCIPHLGEKLVQNGLLFAILTNALLKCCLLGLLFYAQKSFGYEDITKQDLKNVVSRVYKVLLLIILFLTSGMPFSLAFMAKWDILFGFVNFTNSMIWVIVLLTGYTLEIIACFSFIMNITMSSRADKNIVIHNNKIMVFTLTLIISILFIIVSGFFTSWFSV